jgi:hypothetical protein
MPLTVGLAESRFKFVSVKTISVMVNLSNNDRPSPHIKLATSLYSVVLMIMNSNSKSFTLLYTLCLPKHAWYFELV